MSYFEEPGEWNDFEAQVFSGDGKEGWAIGGQTMNNFYQNRKATILSMGEINCWQVGRDGVVSITAVLLNGQMAEVLWFSVMYEDGREQLVNAAQLDHVEFPAQEAGR